MGGDLTYDDKLAKEIAEDLSYEIDREILDANGFTFNPGDYYLLRSSPRAVKLVEKTVAPLGQSGKWWIVEDAAHGYEFLCSERNLNFDTLTEMEVLAWAAK